MLNFIAIAFLAYMVSGPLDVEGSPSPITLDVGNAALPIILGRNGHLGLIIAPIMASSTASSSSGRRAASRSGSPARARTPRATPACRRSG